MKITIATPAPRGSRSGNRVTAERWARLLRELDHDVTITSGIPEAPGDVFVALHARRSAAAVRAVHRSHPDTPIIVTLTGTDVYADIHTSRAARRSLELARALITLQPLAIDELPADVKSKARVIYQSVTAPKSTEKPSSRWFDVCVLGHLRPIKDPFRSAFAARELPESSNIRVVQVGSALTPAMRRIATLETRKNPRYRWMGEVPRARALRYLRRGRLLVLSSKAEGGANVVGEAIVSGVPILASHIPGNLGLLGARYGGYFPVGDTTALRDLLVRAESDQRFYRRLGHQLAGLASRFSPEREKQSWQRLLARVAPNS